MPLYKLNRRCSQCDSKISDKSLSGVCANCYKHWHYVKNKEKIDAANKTNYYDKYRNKPVPKECPICKKQFMGFKLRVCCSRVCSDKKWRTEHSEHVKAYSRELYQTSIQRRIATCLRSRIHKALNGAYKAGSITKNLGCSPDYLRQFLESKFYPNPETGETMSWDNYGRKNRIPIGWEIDHILPLASFDLSDPTQLKKACHYSNLQPLWWRDNLVKGDHLPEDSI